MKKSLMIAVVALCLAGLATAAVETSRETPAEPEAAVEQVQVTDSCPAAAQAQIALSTPPDLFALPWATNGATLPYCSTVHGTTCTVVGALKRCLLAPYEPEMCVCQSDHTWKCYWWL